MNSVWADLRQAAHLMKANPGFTAVAILALALGVGANSAIFGVVNSVLLHTLPYREPDRLVLAGEKRPIENISNYVVSAPDFLDWRRENHVFESMTAFVSSTHNLIGDGDPERLGAGKVSAAFFHVLGVRAEIGRTFQTEEDEPGRQSVVVLSQALWKRRFGGDPQIIGHMLNLSGEPHRVVGVLSADFEFPEKEIELWTPLVLTPILLNRANHTMRVFARLKDGVTLDRAQAEMDTIAGRLESQYPEVNRGHGVSLTPVPEQFTKQIRPALLVLMAAVGLVALLACANVANLLLARGAARQKEMAIRNSLGAGRWRLARQMMTESLVLALLGGIAGLALGCALTPALQAWIPADMNTIGLRDSCVDARVLGFTFGLALITGLLFGAAPAWQIGRIDLNQYLKEGGRSSGGKVMSGRLRNTLVVGEVAISVILLAGAGLMLRSFLALQQVRVGFDPGHLLTLRLQLPRTKYASDQRVATFFQQLLDQVRALPGVKAADAISMLPFTGVDSRAELVVEGRIADPKQPAWASWRVISTGYLQTLKIPLIEGREFNHHDTSGSPRVVLVNSAAARLLWPEGSPLGRRVRVGSTAEWREVVGVIGDVKHQALDEKTYPELYMPLTQSAIGGMTLAIRTSSDPMVLASVVSAQVRNLDKDLPVYNVRTMQQLLDRSVSMRKIYVWLLGAFAVIALTLAVAGIYGVLSYSVAQRTSEIGVRMALGAERGDVLRMVLRQGLILIGAGALIGLSGAIGLMRFLAGLLYGVQATDPWTFAAVTIVLSLAGLAACSLPAWRATRVDPIIALRHE